MDEQSVKVLGTLHPDGTLELAERPSLPAGQVEVTIRPVATERKGENWFECLERIRAKREAAGYPFRTKEEIDGDMEDIRDWGEDRIEEARTTGEGYGPYLARIRARREADGFPFRTKAEIDAEIEDIRNFGGQGLDEDHGRSETESPRDESQ